MIKISWVAGAGDEWGMAMKTIVYFSFKNYKINFEQLYSHGRKTRFYGRNNP